MNAIECVKALRENATGIYNLENDICDLEERRRELLLQLSLAEASLLTQEGGPINGKNAETRAAQLLEQVAPEKVQINSFEREIARTRVRLNFQQSEFKINQAILALFAARPDLSQV